MESPPVRMLLLVVALLAATLFISDRVRDGLSWWDRRYDWRETEYEKLTGLKAGFTIQMFEEHLGAPVFRRVSRDLRYIESTYRGRDHWVQAVTARNRETVLLYAVTSCSREFNPKFYLGHDVPLTLNRSTLASVKPDLLSTFSDYFLSGATANSYFYDFGYGGNPSDYKSYAWGLNDACLNLPPPHTYVRMDGPGLGLGLGGDGVYQGPTDAGGQNVQEFRRRAIVNTYAELAPFVDIREIRPSFQVGVDRLLVRTVAPQTSEEPATELAREVATARSASGPQDPQLIPPRGPPALRGTWGCLLVRVSSYGVLTKRDTRGPFSMANPHPLIRQAANGFLVVQSPELSRERWRQEVQIGFERNPRDAAHVLGQLRRAGLRASRYRRTVLTWKLRPTTLERDAVEQCLPFR